MELVIRAINQMTPASAPVEIVERKGLGHPDTICDAIAEHICIALCRHYLDNFGVILHHNVDKILLCGGAAKAVFGGGEVTMPIDIFISGRVTKEYKGRPIPVDDIAINASRDWLNKHLRLDIDRDIRIHSLLRPGSADLVNLFSQGVPLANDTSCGAGFAPMTDLERTVIAVERRLNSLEVKQTHPEIGEDVKVMGVRHESRIQLTIGCAFVSRFVSSLDDYASKKRAVEEIALSCAADTTLLDVQVTLNAADNFDKESVYLTVTGTSAEAGDDGEVGRGNRVNGLITPYRLMTIEAAAGKNPVSHVGKLYNLMATRIATAITTELHGVHDASCVMVSQIGAPVDQPYLVDIRLIQNSASTEVGHADIRKIVRFQLEQLSSLRDELLSGRLTVY